MASERNTERIIDLLYDELTDEETSSLRNELTDSADLRAEHDALSAVLGDVRDAMPIVDVPTGVHQSIMDMARNAAAEQEEKRRPVTAHAEPSRGLWARLSSGKGGQIALVATVLFAGAFVTRFVEMGDNRLDYSEIATESAPFDFPREQLDPSPIAAKEMPSSSAKPAAEPEAYDRNEGPKNDKEIALDSSDALDLLQTGESKAAEEAGFGSESDRGGLASRSRKSSKKLRKSKDYKPQKSGKKKSNSVVLEKMLGDGLFENSNKGVQPSGRQNMNSSNRDDDAFNVQREAPAAEKVEQKVADKVMPPASKQGKGESVYRAPRQTISAVEQLYTSGDYSTTIQAADEFVALGSGSRTERARALQLKAQALSRTGRYQESLRIYDSISKNYPSYQSGSITSARSEVSRKLEESPQTKKKKEKRRAKPKKNYDFDEQEMSPVESAQ